MTTNLATTVMMAYVPMPDTMRRPVEMMLGWTMWLSIAVMASILMLIGGLWWLEAHEKQLPFGVPAQERLVKVLVAASILATASPIADVIILGK